MQSDLSNSQVKKGIVIAACFLLLRLIAAQLWNSWFGGEYCLSVPFLLFLFGIFLVISVGLVYVDFTRWVGVDLKS